LLVFHNIGSDFWLFFLTRGYIKW